MLPAGTSLTCSMRSATLPRQPPRRVGHGGAGGFAWSPRLVYSPASPGWKSALPRLACPFPPAPPTHPPARVCRRAMPSARPASRLSSSSRRIWMRWPPSRGRPSRRWVRWLRGHPPASSCLQKGNVLQGSSLEAHTWPLLPRACPRSNLTPVGLPTSPGLPPCRWTLRCPRCLWAACWAPCSSSSSPPGPLRPWGVPRRSPSRPPLLAAGKNKTFFLFIFLFILF